MCSENPQMKPIGMCTRRRNIIHRCRWIPTMCGCPDPQAWEHNVSREVVIPWKVAVPVIAAVMDARAEAEISEI